MDRVISMTNRIPFTYRLELIKSDENPDLRNIVGGSRLRTFPNPPPNEVRHFVLVVYSPIADIYNRRNRNPIRPLFFRSYFTIFLIFFRSEIFFFL